VNNPILHLKTEDLSELLSDELFDLLLHKLNDEGIHTVAQFRRRFTRASFFKFFNMFDLYNWKERIKVIDKIEFLFDGKVADSNNSPSYLSSSSIRKEEDRLIVNFFKDDDYSFTIPSYMTFGREDIRLRNWTEFLVQVCEQMIQRHPDDMLSLLYSPLLPNEQRSDFRRRKVNGLSCRQLSNGTWIVTNYNTNRLIKMAKGVLNYCNYPLRDISVYYDTNSKPSSISKRTYQGPKSKSKQSVRESVAHYEVDDIKVEDILLSRGLKGLSFDEIFIEIKNSSIKRSSLRRCLENNLKIVEISKNHYIHRDNLIDIDEAGRILLDILKKQFAQFDGYSNLNLLHDAARIDLSLFINDNALDGKTTVYYIAKHLFSKENFLGHSYIFYGNTHVWEKQPDYELSVKGLLVNQARLNDGLITRQVCEIYFEKIGLGKASFSQGRLTDDNTFYQYDKGEYILSETLDINLAWKAQVTKALDALFIKHDFVIPRDILSSWFDQLPELPQGLPWTLLLLQETLIHNDFGYKPILSTLQQSKDTIAAAIVPNTSHLQSFADVTFAYTSDKLSLPQTMDHEDLRLMLRDAGMLTGNELIFNLHKALDDRRFAWSDRNKTVFIRKE
jgi:hypothetical protein